MSPEDLYTHGALKMEIGTVLYTLIARSGRGMVFSDRTRISSPPADLSVEPDVVAVLWKTLDEGRLREVPSAGERPGRYIELEGAPDLVVEIVSDSSVGKDLKTLPKFYAAAGLPELWTVDARGREIRCDIQGLASGGYRTTPGSDCWLLSPFLGLEVRLSRSRVQPHRWVYTLETRAPGE
jgi:Uma2 family endonuclease